MSDMINHYKWLDKHLNEFWKKVRGKSLDEDSCAGIVSAHGDKGYSYKRDWEDAGIPFPHGMALFLLTYTDMMDRPMYEAREWVIEKYEEYKDYLPEIDETDEDVVCPFRLAVQKERNKNQ